LVVEMDRVVSVVFGLWRVCFPPCLVRPGRRLPVQGLSEVRVDGSEKTKQINTSQIRTVMKRTLYHVPFAVCHHGVPVIYHCLFPTKN